MIVNNLIIELTRRCNLKCEHCLRGAAQKVDIDPKIVCKFLKKNQIDSIGLTFTGGEPCLNVSSMNVIVDYIIKNKIYVNMFYMATNGTIFDPNMLKSLADLYSIVEEDMFRLEISQDEYHTKPINPLWNLLNFQFREKAFNVICEGRGRKINPNGRIPGEYEWTWDENGDLFDGTVYINALGQICKDCDYSYATQKKKNYGHCLSKPLRDF